MRTRTGGVVTICLVVVTVLVVLFTNSEPVILNSESPSGEPKTTTISEGLSVSVSDMLWHIIIEKRFEIPEKYVELTEEEVARFSALQAALQILEGSNQTEVWYKTSEGETKRIDSYLATKIGDKYNCKACGGISLNIEESSTTFISCLLRRDKPPRIFSRPPPFLKGSWLQGRRSSYA